MTQSEEGKMEDQEATVRERIVMMYRGFRAAGRDHNHAVIDALHEVRACSENQARAWIRAAQINGVHPGALEKMARHGVTPRFAYNRIHGRLLDPHGGKTLCELVDADGNVAAFAIATCHPDEAFCKRTGRTLALTRALKELK